MLNKSQKIAISKNFIISMLFVCLIFAVVGFDIEESYAVDLNETGDVAIMGLNTEDKLGNSQEDNILEVDSSGENVLGTNYIVKGKTFQDIQNSINNAHEGDNIYLVGEYGPNGHESTISINKKLTITSTSSATLNGDGVSGIFYVENNAPGTVISNLRFINAEKDVGSAIFVNAKNVVIDNCIFEDNHCIRGGVVSSRYHGNIAENLTVKNCEFRNNSGCSKNLENVSNAAALGAYGVYSKIINCIFDSNWVKSKFVTYGGAIQIGLEGSNHKYLVSNCTFINNQAISLNEHSHGGAGCVRKGVEYVDCIFINNFADEGGALTFHSSGKLQNCTFINNTAAKYGGAVSTGFFDNTMEMEINDCYFEGNDAPRGGAIQALGLNIYIVDSNFEKNHADIYGGALNINALNVQIKDSSFGSNIADIDGGAIYTKGNDTLVNHSSFISNEAKPDYNKSNYGLGGAIYINSTRANVLNSNFYFNTARNGSAIYYDEYGDELILKNNTLFENQAWVYLLPVYAHDIYYGQSEELKSIIHGGNNIAKYNNLAVSNAIYNNAENSHLLIDGESPVNGATNNGKLYQDDREYNMEISLTVEKDDGSIVYNKTLNSNYLGEVSDELNDLQPGRYQVTARHLEDTYYKTITNTTSFNVIPKIDSQIRKASSLESYNLDDIVVWTLNITNNGPNKATNVTVRDVLPKGLIYIDDDSNNAYDPQSGILYIGDVEVNQTLIVNIYAQINKTGEIVNAANITSKEFDVDLTNNHDEAKITVPRTCDLAVIKSVNNSNPNYNDLVKWSIVVRNNGPDVAHNVVMEDILPKSLIYISNSGNYNNATGKWNIGTIGINKSVKLDIVCRVNSTGVIQNNVSVKSREIDRNMSNNKDSSIINVNASSDLSIEKSIDTQKANLGDEITWKLVITNNGPNKATRVKITDVLPKGLIYVNSTLERGKYSNGIINVGTMAVGERLTYKIISKVNKTGTITNIASVVGREYDYDMSNNKDNASVFINRASDLEVVKIVNISNPNYGDKVTWNIVVRNNGPDQALDVVVSDVLPKSLIWVSDDGNGKYNHVTGKWIIGVLNVGKTVQLNIVTLINSTGVIQNNVSVNGSRFDHNLSNNDDDAIINVSKTADVSIVKLVNNSNPAYGDIIKWTLIAKNNGPDKATSVSVDDILPKGLVLLAVNASKGIYDNGLWALCCLEKDDEQVLEIICMVNKTGVITNFASITAQEVDLNQSNNRVNKSIKVPSTVDLEVVKQVSNKTPYFGDSITWFISVKNNGPDRATNVALYDLLDDGLILTDYSASVGTFNGNKWSVGRLNKGITEYLNITCIVNKLGLITNEAVANCSQVDRNRSNNNCSEVIDVRPVTDLSVTKLVNNSNPNYGDLIKWIIVVANNGPNNATGVIVRDIMPTGIELVEASDYIEEDGTWYVGDLACNDVKELDVICKVVSTGDFENIAIVSGEEHDSNLDNNRDVEYVHVDPACDLSITKTVSKYHYKVGDTVNYSIKIANDGPDVARNVIVNEIPDKLLTLKSFSLTKGSFDESEKTWAIDALDEGEYAELYIKAMAAGAGIVENFVSATSDTFDYNLDNNYDEVDVNVDENDSTPKKQENIESTYNSTAIDEIDNDLHKNYVTGNPFAVLMILVVFLILFAGGNFSNKR